MSAGIAYAKRFPGGFVDLPLQTTDIDQQFLNAVEAALLQLIGAAPTADGQVAQWDNANTRFGPALLLNKNVDPAAAIAKSKIDLTGANGIVNVDVAAAAAIARSKLDFGSGLVNADISAAAALALAKLADPGVGKVIGSIGAGAVAVTPAITTIFDVVVGRGGTVSPYTGGSMIDPAAPAATIDSNTILGGVLPTTFKHLRLVMQGRLTGALNYFGIRFNNDAATTYLSQMGQIAGSAVAAAPENFVGYGPVAILAGSGQPAGDASIVTVDIPAYNETTFHKVWISRGGYSGDERSFNGRWPSTAAVTRIAIGDYATPGTLVAGTHVTLYAWN